MEALPLYVPRDNPAVDMPCDVIVDRLPRDVPSGTASEYAGVATYAK